MGFLGLVIMLSLAVVPNEGAIEIPCPLVWKSMVVGEMVPSNAVTTGGSDIYAARAQSESGTVVGGFYNNGSVFLNDLNNNAQNSSDYEILTNPNYCILQWKPWQFNPTHNVVVGNETNKFIGRAWKNETFLSGTIYSGQLYLTIPDSEGDRPVTSSSYDVLRSYLQGLNLVMDSFVFDQDPFQPSQDFMGLDEIHNGADTYVRQIVTHKRRVLETSKIISTTFKGLTFNYRAKISADIPIRNTSIPIEAEAGGELTTKSENSEEVYNESEKEITVTKDVLVAPFTSVQVCSTVSLAEGFQAQYTARGVYSAPGLNSEQVIALLRSEEDKVGTPDGNGGAITTETGSFAGNMAVTTQFIVVPWSANGGCREIQRKIFQLKTDRKRKSLSGQEIDRRQKEIDDIISQYSRKSGKKDKSNIFEIA